MHIWTLTCIQIFNICLDLKVIPIFSLHWPSVQFTVEQIKTTEFANFYWACLGVPTFSITPFCRKNLHISQSQFVSSSSFSRPIGHWPAEAAWRDKSGLAYTRAFLQNGILPWVYLGRGYSFGQILQKWV